MTMMVWALALAGCGGPKPGGARESTTVASGLARPSPAAMSSDHRVALVGQTIVTLEALAPMLAEAAGGEVLEEYALGVAVREELARTRTRVDEVLVREERVLLGRTLSRLAGAPDSDAERLIAEVRARRGLGDHRFRALLERNAGLRLLVRFSDRSLTQEIDDSELRAAYAVKYGARVRARAIVVPTDRDAAEVNRRLATQPFAEVAVAMSADASSAVGGLLDPISLEDPLQPAPLREALAALQPGGRSAPFGVTWNGRDAVAIVLLEDRVAPPDGAPTFEQARADLRDEVRLVREARAMDALARRLLASRPPAVLDRSFGWSWDVRRGSVESAP